MAMITVQMPPPRAIRQIIASTRVGKAMTTSTTRWLRRSTLPVWSKYSNSPSHRRLRLDYRPHFGLSSARLSLILSVKRDGKGGGEMMDWKHLLAYITGTVDQELLLRNEYLVTENRVLRHQITGRIRLTDAERKTLAEIGKKLGKQALKEVAHVVKPDTILGWHKKLVAQKFDGSKQRQTLGRPKVD